MDYNTLKLTQNSENTNSKLKHRYVCLDESSYDASIDRSEIGVKSIIAQKTSQKIENPKKDTVSLKKNNPNLIANQVLQKIKAPDAKIHDYRYLNFYAPNGSPAQKEIVSILDMSSIVADNY